MTKEIIKVNKLSKHFDKTIALNQIDFSIKPGEIFGFLGPSGSGKTTTINILTGQLDADGGIVTLFGKDVKEMKRSDLEKIGIVSDESGYYEKLTLYKNLLLYGKLYNVKKSRIKAVLKQVGLYESKDKPAEELSTGMKQRMLLARALINKPKILFLDEPTSGLDPSTSKKIHHLLLNLKEAGTTIFLTTHDMNEATLLCDQLALLNKGELVETGTPMDIIGRYNHSQRLKVTFDDGQKVAVSFEKIDELIRTAKKKIFSIHSCEPTLEDIFIKLTGVKLDVQ